MIGGGLAGLSSAIALADAGCRVSLIERRPHLGGRATSYSLPDGTEIDNCQHVTLGCCTNLADFYRRVGAEDKIRFYDRLDFVDAQGRISTMEASPLPPPLHMAPSFLLFSILTLRDKRAIGAAMFAIARSAGAPPGIEGISMLDWLCRMKQTPSAIARFWRVVLVSALDEELDRTEAKYGIEVFWKAFLSNKTGYRVGIPSVPLADLYEGCRDAIVRQGGEVRVRSSVRRVQTEAGRFAFATLDGGSQIYADACIVAVPHDVLFNILPDAARNDPALRGLDRIRTSPITGVHLWFDRVVMQEPFLTLLDHTTQWIFNKSLLSEAAETNHAAGRLTNGPVEALHSGNTQYLQLVISASYDLLPKSRQEITDLCMREIAEVLPAAREARLLKATVVKEVNATFSPEPGVDRWRPGHQSVIGNLFYAGDWTRTGWPATMEGAVRSGYLAAESLLTSFGQPRNFVRADLPLEGLCKFWAERR